MDNTLIFVGEIHTPYNTLEQCPKMTNESGPECKLIIDKKYQEAMLGLEIKQKIMLLYFLDKSNRNKMTGHICGDRTKPLKGTFALRSPHRPNPIAVSVISIEDIKENIVYVRGLDCLNGTKILDIKPATTLDYN